MERLDRYSKANWMLKNLPIGWHWKSKENQKKLCFKRTGNVSSDIWRFYVQCMKNIYLDDINESSITMIYCLSTFTWQTRLMTLHFFYLRTKTYSKKMSIQPDIMVALQYISIKVYLSINVAIHVSIIKKTNNKTLTFKLFLFSTSSLTCTHYKTSLFAATLYTRMSFRAYTIRHQKITCQCDDLSCLI